MARKAKDNDRPRLTHPVSFRLAEDDHTAYLEKVHASGLKPSEFFRNCVLKNKTQVIARSPTSGDKRRLLYLFNKAGNNLNQLARAANAAEKAGRANSATYQEILAELQAITRLMQDVLICAD